MDAPDIAAPTDSNAWRTERVKIASILYIFMAVLVGFNLIVSFYLGHATLLYINLFSLAVLVLGVGFHYLKMVSVSRILLAVTPSLINLLVDAVLQPTNAGRTAPSIALNLAFLLIPFIIFDVQERVEKYLCAGINVGLLFLFPYVNALLETDLPFNHQQVETVLISFAYVLVFVSAFTIDHLFLKQKKGMEAVLQNLEKQRATLSNAQAELNVSLEALQKSKIDEEKRNWVATGVTTFADLLRNQKNIENIYQVVLPTICKYTASKMAALYIYDEENRLLKLTASFAGNRARYENAEVQTGEGLIGQCFVDKEPIYLTDVPSDYAKISSGLGEANPKCVFVMPLLHNDHPVGVLELATFEPYDKYQLDYFQKVTEILASTLESAHSNEKTRKLLEITQEQTEQMRAQEEEMRQNMEELMATQEEIARRNEEMHQFLHTLDHSGICLISFSADGTILQMNQTTMRVLGYTDEVMAKPQTLADIVASDFFESSIYTQVFTPQNEPEDYFGELNLRRTTGETVYLLGSLNIEESLSKENFKIRLIAVDITQQKKLQQQMEEKEKKVRELLQESNRKNLAVTQAEEKARKVSKELEIKLDALDYAGIGMLELKVSGAIAFANKCILEQLEYTEDELINKNLKLFMPPEFLESEEGKKFWSELRNGNITTDNIGRITKSGKKIQIQSFFHTIFDAEGLPVRILNIYK